MVRKNAGNESAGPLIAGGCGAIKPVPVRLCRDGVNFPLDGSVYLQIAADHPVIRRVGGSRGLCETSLRGD